MTDHDSLVAAILANPDEDTPRLMLADYLDELGDDLAARRAAFIRSQVGGAAADRLGTCLILANCATTKRLSRVGTRGPTRFADLVRGEPWRHPNIDRLTSPPDDGWLQLNNSTSAVLWRRGFIEAALCSGVSLGPVLVELRRHPVREVRLTNSMTRKLVRTLVGTGLEPAAIRCLIEIHGISVNEQRGTDSSLHVALAYLRQAFPHLLRVAYDFNRPGASRCPFQLVSKRGLGRKAA